MKIQELRQKNKEDLSRLLAEAKEKLATLQFDLAGGKVKNIKEVRAAKKDIARILTLQREAKKLSKM